MGVIYILTNPSFKDYVKIGYADDVERRLVELNRSECIPFAFRIYATYEVPTRLTDMSLHKIIDKLNPTLRAIDTFKGKPRVKEFYAMSAEDAFSLLEGIAEIHDRKDKLSLYKETKEEKEEETIAELVEIESESRRKSLPIRLEEYLVGKRQDFVDIYQVLHDSVFNVLDDVDIHVLPQYVAWRVNGKHFLELHIQRNNIMMLTLMPRRTYTIGDKVPDKFLWTLNYRTYLTTQDDIEEAKQIIIESYNQR